MTSYQTHLQTYLFWLQERGLPVPAGMCEHCGYTPVDNAKLTVCYPRVFTAQEDEVMRQFDAIWVKMQRLPLRNCRGNQLCAQQRRDLQRRKYVLLLGNECSKALFNTKPDFADEHGRYCQQLDWGATKFMLTLHPRDIIRYPDNKLVWQHDLSEAIRALRHH